MSKDNIIEFGKQDKNKLKRILIIQLESVMELVMSTSLMQEIKRAYPNAVIEAVVIEEFKDCIDDAAFIDVIHPVGYAVFERLNTIIADSKDEIYNENYAYNFANSLGDFDLVYNLSHDAFSCWLNDNIFVREDKKGGVVLPTWEWVYVDRWQSYFIAMNEFRDKNRFTVTDILRGMLELKRDSGIEPYITIDDSDDEFIRHDRDMIALSIGYSKMTPVNIQYFAELAVVLYDNGYLPVLVGDSFNTGEYTKIAELSGGKAVNLSGENKYSKIAGILSKCVLLISKNELLNQVAAACGVPFVFLADSKSYYWELAPYTTNQIIVAADMGGKKAIYNIPVSYLYFIAKYKLGIISDKQFYQTVGEYPEIEIIKPFFTNFEIDSFSTLNFEKCKKTKRSTEEVFNDILRFSIANVYNHNSNIEYSVFLDYIEKMGGIDSKELNELNKIINGLYVDIKQIEMNYMQWYTMVKRNIKRGKGLDMLSGVKSKRQNMTQRIDTTTGIIFDAENRLRELKEKSVYYNIIIPLLLIEIAMSQFEENYIYEGYATYKKYGNILEITKDILEQVK